MPDAAYSRPFATFVDLFRLLHAFFNDAFADLLGHLAKSLEESLAAAQADVETHLRVIGPTSGASAACGDLVADKRQMAEHTFYLALSEACDGRDVGQQLVALGDGLFDALYVIGVLKDTLLAPFLPQGGVEQHAAPSTNGKIIRSSHGL